MEELVALELKKALLRYNLVGVDYYKTLDLVKRLLVQHAMDMTPSLAEQEMALNLKQPTYSMIRRKLGITRG